VDTDDMPEAVEKGCVMVGGTIEVETVVSLLDGISKGT